MDSKFYRALTATLWLALPLTAWQFWSVREQLPASVATHFGATGQPNGWMPRDGLLIFSIGLMMLLLVAFTWALTRVRKPDVLAWSLLTMLYVVMGALFSINTAVLNYNLYAAPVNIIPAISVISVAAMAVMGVALMTKRGAELPRHDDVVEAEEVHASPLWALLFAVLTAIELCVIAIIPLRGLRLVLMLPALLLLGVTALAWSGFHYRFTAHGVEISTLGLRLRSIPLHNIKAYAVAPWSPLGGYGIRGIGERRAYVWGNTGVRIMLSDGEVFLGHREPERIVNDLNSIGADHQARESTQSEQR